MENIQNGFFTAASKVLLVAFALCCAAHSAPAAERMASSSTTFSPVPERRLELPKSGVIKVAIVVSDIYTLIDMAGPLQTFGQVVARVPEAFADATHAVQDGNYSPFETFTVADSVSSIHMGASGNARVTVVPDYSFENAPEPDIVLVGAQAGNSEQSLNYLRRMAARGKLMLSVCTGVSKFAKAGLLDSKYATSHHDFIAALSNKYPKVRWLADKAWVHSAPMLYTAGGETSGFELALHVVELYFGHDVAVQTARSMEYRGPAWQA